MNLYAYVGGNPVNWIDIVGLACKKVIESQLQKVREFEEIVTHKNPLDPIVDLFPPVESVSIYTQYKYLKAEYQWFDAVYEVCTDECGVFISRKKLYEVPRKGTQYYEILHKWFREVFGVLGEAGPNLDPIADDNGWIQIF